MSFLAPPCQKNGSQNESGGLSEVFVQKELQPKMLELVCLPMERACFSFPSYLKIKRLLEWNSVVAQVLPNWRGNIFIKAILLRQ